MLSGLKIAVILLGLACLSFQAWAKPDVSFRDSNGHNQAYLVHKFRGNYIQFFLSNAGFDIPIPAHFYDYRALKIFLENEYEFANPDLRDEFVRMLRQCFESRFNGMPFLTEVVRMLESFRRAHPEGVI
ncbi:MAG: hypothetical protein ACREGC_02915 [Minisyncoccia bacterium]